MNFRPSSLRLVVYRKYRIINLPENKNPGFLRKDEKIFLDHLIRTKVRNFFSKIDLYFNNTSGIFNTGIFLKKIKN